MGQDVYRFPEQTATFNGGAWQDFDKYISEQMKNTDVRAQPGSRGLVIVSFIIDYKGNLSYAHAVLSDAPELEEEAIQIVKASSKKWKPAKQDGENVSSVFVYPFRFAQ
jgi:outer membrane biosynthesis protein TonB